MKTKLGNGEGYDARVSKSSGGRSIYVSVRLRGYVEHGV